MKILHMLAAAGLMAAGLGSTAAEARDHRDYRGHRYEQRYDQRHDRGNHYGWRNDHRGKHWRGNDWGRHCRTEWRHHQRVRICR